MLVATAIGTCSRRFLSLERRAIEGCCRWQGRGRIGRDPRREPTTDQVLGGIHHGVTVGIGFFNGRQHSTASIGLASLDFHILDDI